MSFNTKKTTVASPNLAYTEMATHWPLVDALDSGTLGMRAESTKWLPMEEKESQKSYSNRLARSTVFGAYSRSLDTFSGIPFIRPVVLEDMPVELEYLQDDADSTGAGITSFSYDLLRESLHRGVAHFLVEQPFFEKAPSIEEVRLNKIRPYFCPVSAKDLIAWSTEKVGGVEVLTEIRILETTTVKDGWGEVEVSQVRVYRPNEILLFEVNDKGEYGTDPTEVRANNLGYIPLLSVYSNKTGHMTGTPSFEDLAWLNLKHYQQTSDFENIIHVANVPILFASGVAEGELDGSEIGPNRLISATSDKASLGYVEHTGAALGNTMKAIEALENRMAAMGADLVVRKSVDRQTAAARMADKSESLSILQIVINDIESTIEQGVKIAAEWIGIEEPSPTANIADNLDLPSGPNTTDILIQFVMENSGMSVEQAISELRRRGVISDTYKLDTTLADREVNSDEDNLEDENDDNLDNSNKDEDKE